VSANKCRTDRIGWLRGSGVGRERRHPVHRDQSIIWVLVPADACLERRAEVVDALGGQAYKHHRPSRRGKFRRKPWKCVYSFTALTTYSENLTKLQALNWLTGLGFGAVASHRQPPWTVEIRWQH
jgi:hypothetical protein